MKRNRFIYGKWHIMPYIWMQLGIKLVSYQIYLKLNAISSVSAVTCITSWLTAILLNVIPTGHNGRSHRQFGNRGPFQYPRRLKMTRSPTTTRFGAHVALSWKTICASVVPEHLPILIVIEILETQNCFNIILDKLKVGMKCQSGLTIYE